MQPPETGLDRLIGTIQWDLQKHVTVTLSALMSLAGRRRAIEKQACAVSFVTIIAYESAWWVSTLHSSASVITRGHIDSVMPPCLLYLLYLLSCKQWSCLIQDVIYIDFARAAYSTYDSRTHRKSWRQPYNVLFICRTVFSRIDSCTCERRILKSTGLPTLSVISLTCLLWLPSMSEAGNIEDWGNAWMQPWLLLLAIRTISTQGCT